MPLANMTDDLQYSTRNESMSQSNSSSSDLPQYYHTGAQQSTDFYRDQLGRLPTGGYTGPRVAGLSPLQQLGIGQGNTYLNSSTPLYGQGAGLMGSAAGQMAQTGNWQESQMMRHMNPYVSGALTTMQNLSNQNLMENVLPGVNSTFTGAGQFGSTRNADFTNRAIRDQQQTLANAQGTMLNTAYGQAADDYYRWDQQMLNSAQQQGALGQLMGQYGITGLNTGMNLGQISQQNNQQNLDANMAAWRENYSFPLEMYNALAGGYNTSVGRLSPAQQTSGSSSSSGSSSTYNLGSSLSM